MCGGTLAAAAVLATVNSPYLGWGYSIPEATVTEVAVYTSEWGFVCLAPSALVAATIGVFLMRKKYKA